MQFFARLADLFNQRRFDAHVHIFEFDFPPRPVIGVGIGVDYAIYIVDRIRQERGGGLGLAQALDRAVRTTGQAIGFTASTLVVGIVFWIPVSSLRFSAETSLLLSILMIVNALGAVLLVPSLIRLLPDALLKRSRLSG